jgi:hypothetical protein
MNKLLFDWFLRAKVVRRPYTKSEKRAVKNLSASAKQNGRRSRQTDDLSG